MFAAGFDHFQPGATPENPYMSKARYRKAIRVGTKNDCFMKKIMFLLAAFTFCFQAGKAQTRVGIAAGVSMANLRGSTMDGNTKAGGYISMVLDKPFCKNFSFHPTLSYVQKGTSIPEPTLLLKKRNLALRYIEFNPNFLFNMGSGNGSSFSIGVGPSVSFELPSKRVEIAKDASVPKTTTTIHFGKESINDMKGLDYGANLLATYRMAGGFFLSANYNLGLRNLVTEGSSGDLKSMYFGIQLGYYLENGKAKK